MNLEINNLYEIIYENNEDLADSDTKAERLSICTPCEFKDNERWNVIAFNKNRKIKFRYENGIKIDFQKTKPITELGTEEDSLMGTKKSVLRQKQKAEAKTKKPEKQGVLYLRQVRDKWDWYLRHKEDFFAKYVGGIKNVKPNGQGKLTYVKWKQKGEKYEGEWKNGEKHGKGTRTLPDGRKYEGEWRLNKPWNTKNYDKYGNILSKFLKGVLTVEKKTILSIPLSKPKEESKNKSKSLVEIIKNKSKTIKGLTMTYEPKELRFFQARFKKL